jgi:MFS family permease
VSPVNSRIRLTLLYLVAFIASAGATLLTMGIFFFTANRWGWDARENLAFAATQGMVYTVSALLAHAVSTRWGRRKSLVGLYVLMTLVAIVAAMVFSHVVICICLMLYMFFVGMTWPMLESLCSESPNAHEMSRRIGAYNVTWAISGAAALFLTGLLIERWSSGIFVATALLHGLCALMMLWIVVASPIQNPLSKIQNQSAAHLDPEPELLQSRRLALWLSRIALPAMYVVNYGLSAILPLLPVMRQFTPAWQTLYGSLWVVARMLMFAILAAATFWHTRPRLLLVASAIMLISFFMVTLAPSQWFDPRISPRADLLWMIFGQILLGIAMAMIYMASLYFGMVLSQSSTAHGGYHEALIGLGGILGPGAGALTQTLFPGNLLAAIIAVGGVVGVSVFAAAVASLAIRKSTSREVISIA